MIIDTSALAAVLFGEPDGDRYLDVIIARVGDLAISAATMVEAGIVVESRLGPDGAGDLIQLVARSGTSVVPLDAEQAELAHGAWRRFGKGRHPAGLNLGDCFSYALARARDEELLFKGGDFAQTDVRAALG